MDKIYEEITYKNVEGYKATFTHFIEHGNAEVSLEIDGEIHTYNLAEAYRTMIALQAILKKHDPDYEIKMLSSMEDRLEDKI